ncbi:hypothetical protein SYNGFB01_02860 [Synechococcus sp. GFB01]|nr:hypothetical protein SYNGFB01_02860 [Synechococcus sp. GFB01]
MQPYFYPYLGYFRLFAAADIVVLFDCVQFPRRGRVHRSALPSPPGQSRWLTLPLRHQPRHTRIADLHFQSDAGTEFLRRLNGHDWYRSSKGDLADEIRSHLTISEPSVADYLERQLRAIVWHLKLPAVIIRSSDLNISPTFAGQQRVLAVVKALGGKSYVNPPAGRHLYQPETFQSRGITLRFLSPYTGLFPHALPALMDAEPDTVRRDVRAQTILEAP